MSTYEVTSVSMKWNDEDVTVTPVKAIRPPICWVEVDPTNSKTTSDDILGPENKRAEVNGLIGSPIYQSFIEGIKFTFNAEYYSKITTPYVSLGITSCGELKKEIRGKIVQEAISMLGAWWACHNIPIVIKINIVWTLNNYVDDITLKASEETIDYHGANVRNKQDEAKRLGHTLMKLSYN